MPATLPKCCPHGTVSTCRIGAHSVRERRTGPKHPLWVVRCKTHRRCFTLYPPRWYPYARQALDSDGLFAVGKEVAANGMGTDLPDQHAPRWRRTLYTWLALCGLWLGFASKQTDAEQAAFELGLDAYKHRDLRASYLAASPRGRGEAVCAAWALIADEPWRRLLRVGYALGLCGRCFALDRDGRIPLVQPFHQLE